MNRRTTQSRRNFLTVSASILTAAGVTTIPPADRVAGAEDVDSSGGSPGRAAPRYQTPEQSPRFAVPEFISRPLVKAYPGIEYNIRPAVRGGTFPYSFRLKAAPRGMQIDRANGVLKWLASESERPHTVEIEVEDAAGRTAVQRFQLEVTRTGFFFVSPAGDDTQSGTIAEPWRSVERVAIPPAGFVYPEGAIVVFRGGEYKIDRPGSASKNGVSQDGANSVPITADSPKIWLAYPGEKPVIDLGWSEEKHRAAQQAQRESGKLLGAGREPATHRGYGHRFVLANGSDYFYMDGFEVKNACYYMFVMFDGRNTVHFRRCDMHHLWSDWAENPGFLFTYAGERRGNIREWGVRPQCRAYRNFVIQDNRFHDRFYLRERRGRHGGAFVFYTVHDSIIEDNEFFDIHRGECFADKDNGLGNTYRGNIVRGDCSLLGQWCNDETEICYNYIEGNLRIGLQPGWVRNIWVHHNAISGSVTLMGGGTKPPDKLADAAGDFSSPETPDTAQAIRDFPGERRLIHFYRNVIDASDEPGEGRKAQVITSIPNHKGFADRWRYVRWDENLVDTEARIELLWNRYRGFSLFQACGFDRHGVQARVQLDAEGYLADGSPYRSRFGR